MSEFNPIVIASKVFDLFDGFTKEQATEILESCTADTSCLSEILVQSDCSGSLNPVYAQNFSQQIDELFSYFEGHEDAVFAAIAATVISLPLFADDPDFLENS